MIIYKNWKKYDFFVCFELNNIIVHTLKEDFFPSLKLLLCLQKLIPNSRCDRSDVWTRLYHSHKGRRNKLFSVIRDTACNHSGI